SEIVNGVEQQRLKDGIREPAARRFPVRVALSLFARALAEDDEVRSVLSYLAARIARRTDRAVSVADLRAWLGAYPWFIAFDGLDEVPASSNRDDVLGAISDFWVEAAECNSDILVLATTRPQ